MDRFDAMSVFVAVVEAGSLSAAARRLRLPLATVSRRISELEAHLDIRLFERGYRSLRLTDAGLRYVAACRRIIDDVDDAERAATGEYQSPRGELSITAPALFGRNHVLPIIAEFLGAYPTIDVRLALLDRVVNLLEEHVDVAVRIGALPDSSLVALKLGSIRRVVCATPAYLDARGMPRKPTDLGDHDCITFEGVGSPRSWVFRSGRKDTTIDIHSRLIVNTAEAAVDMAVAGIGVTRLLSYQVATEVRARKLAVVLKDFEPDPIPVSILHNGGRQLPLKLRAFLDFAGPRLRKILSDNLI